MDNKHNKLDDFLRDQLNDSSENASWNVPGDHVFDNAINALPGKKKNNRRIWLIIPFLFLAVFIGREFLHMNQINKLENKITSLEESLSSSSLSEVITNNQHSLETSGLNNSNDVVVNQNDIKNKQSYSNSAETTDVNSYSTEGISGLPVNSISKEKEHGIANNANTEAISKTNTSATQPSRSRNSKTESLSPSSSESVVKDSGINLDQLSLNSENQNTRIAQGLQQWDTPILLPLPFSGLPVQETYPEIALSTPSVEVTIPADNILPMRYGVLVGGNQSWLTMKNIPQSPGTKLYEYDNSQPGAGAYAFIEKSLSNKLTVQTGIGYQLNQNRSVLEDKFLFEEDNVVIMPDGNEIYLTPIDVINPLGDHSTMLAFRVSDQMHQNDILSEYTTMKQKLHTVHFDISLDYIILSINRFDISLGAGLGIGYLAGLENDFNVSYYHNGELQSSRTEAPKNLNDTQKWYGQAIGKINIEYRLTDRMGLVLETQYRGGISSLRRGTEANGSQTYLHALVLSAGLTHSF